MNQNYHNSRQLVCIMFTDIVGYTALMGDDEQKALTILKANRQLQKPLIKKYGGQWIKELGDGVIATFASVTNAIQAAAEIQVSAKQNHQFELRIGLHMSEVVFENGDIFGDGVNITARIQSVAKVGGIVISETVQKNITNKNGIETNFLSEEKLKNVKIPVSLYELIITDAFVQEQIIFNEEQLLKNNEVQKRSLAVLPFRNMSNEVEQEYFSDGIAEEVIVTLSAIENLKVIGRSSSFQFKGSEMPLTQIGTILQVNTILEGSVRKQGNKVRIHAVLVNVSDGEQLWAEKYDRELTDIFEIQDDIAHNIAQKLKLKFFGDDNRVLPINMEAYELVLKGRFYVEKFIEGFDKAMACFSRAIEIDPNYGEAYCELGKLHLLLAMLLFQPPKDGFTRAMYFAEKALTINNELGGAHYVLGQVYFWHYWDFEKSKAAYLQAEKCKDSFYFTGVIMDPWYPAFALGDFETAIKSIFKIIENDPLSLYAQIHLGYFYSFSNQKDKALETLNKILAAVPSFSEAERLIGYNYLLANENEKGLEHAKRAAEMAQGLGWAQNILIIALAKNNKKDEALLLLDAYENQKGPLHVSPVGIGLIHTALGDLDKAFYYFQKAIDEKDIWVVSYKYSAEFKDIRGDKRFEALIKQINYPLTN